MPTEIEEKDTVYEKAPAVVKLLGEHASLYDKIAVAAAVSIYAEATVSKYTEGRFLIELPDFKLSKEFGEKQLNDLFSEYKKQDIKTYYETSAYDKVILPYATIVARLLNEFGERVLGRKAIISSKIPAQSGLASSGACSTAFTKALVKSAKLIIEDPEIIDVIRDGERVCHKNKNAGGIDVNTSYFGGIVMFAPNKTKKIQMGLDLTLLLVNTGPKKSTAEMVAHVAELYKKDKENTQKILDAIGECSIQGIEAIKNLDVVALGDAMFKDHELLRQLGVSANKLDEVVYTAKESGEFGAKLSGGGGGGIAIVLSKNPDQFSSRMQRKNLKVMKTSILN